MGKERLFQNVSTCKIPQIEPCLYLDRVAEKWDRKRSDSVASGSHPSLYTPPATDEASGNVYFFILLGYSTFEQAISRSTVYHTELLTCAFISLNILGPIIFCDTIS